MNNETKGLFYGLLGVLGFSLTLPATRIAVDYFGVAMVGLGRALVAAILAAIVLLIRREARPSWQQTKGLAIVAFGVIIGFPLLSAWAMNRVSSAHGAVVLALLPLATAGAAAWRTGERPSRKFWMASIAGSLTVLAFTIHMGLGRPQLADLALVGAVAAAALGYAEGGKLSRVLGGWQVIAWALVIAGPFLIIPVVLSLSPEMWNAPPKAWMCFAYLSIGSQFLAFIAWYSGLGMGGVARVSQLQYLQPFFTIVWSSLFLGESITLTTLGAALIIVIFVNMGRKSSISQKDASATKSSPNFPK